MSFYRAYVEKEETCPGGGAMRYVVEVSEPTIDGEKHCMISLEEGSTAHGEKESMLLDLDTARWLVGILSEAIAYAVTVELRRR